MKRKTLIISKLTLSLGLLGLLLFSTDLESLSNIFLEVDPRPFAIVLTIMIVGMVVSAYKWQSLLHATDIDCGLWTLVRYYLIGIYFNNFLPTSIGGDAMRTYLVSVRYGRGLSAVTSVLAERVSGLIALLLIAGALSIGGELFPMQNGLGIFFLFAVLILAVLTQKILWKPIFAQIPDSFCIKMEAFFSVLRKYCIDRRALFTMGWTSLIYPFLVGLAYYYAGLAFSVYIPFLDLVVICSLVTLLTLIPLSLNGLGLREGGFVYFLGLQGVPQTQALSLSLLVFGLTLLLSLFGGILLLFERSRTEILSQARN